MKLQVILFVTCFCPALTLAILHHVKPTGKKLDNSACADVICQSGSECHVTKNGSTSCECVRSCPVIKRHHGGAVCASDGRTYRNHCELHKTACHRDDSRLKPVAKRPCPAKPVVCTQVQRDALITKARRALQGSQPDSCKTAPVGMDTAKLLACLESVHVLTPHDKHLTRSLCVEAVLEAADLDGDWLLNSHEFHEFLKSAFKPPTKNCSLEENVYEDGTNRMIDCNKCICACGRWVCSSMVCDHSIDFEDWDMPRKLTPIVKRKLHRTKGSTSTTAHKKLPRFKLIKSKEWE